MSLWPKRFYVTLGLRGGNLSYLPGQGKDYDLEQPNFVEERGGFLWSSIVLAGPWSGCLCSEATRKLWFSLCLFTFHGYIKHSCFQWSISSHSPPHSYRELCLFYLILSQLLLDERFAFSQHGKTFEEIQWLIQLIEGPFCIMVREMRNYSSEEMGF